MDLRNGAVDVYGSRSQFYHDWSLNQAAIMPLVVSSETDMLVHRLMLYGASFLVWPP